MARASFGGSGDYSGAFGSLYSASKNAGKAEQDARDADMLDRYSHGLVTDDEIIAYIKSRADATLGDAERHQYWEKVLRQYVEVIGDNKATAAYENGGSIVDLIAHYEQRLATMSPDSNEYRDLSTKINELRDRKVAEAITSGSQEIIDKVQAGQATYEDLLGFYQEQQRSVRPGSDLAKQLDSRIGDAKDQIEQIRFEGSLEKLQYEYQAGKISSGSFAQQVRALAAPFEKSDPKRYYQMLELALRVAQGGGGGSGAATKDANALIDAQLAQRNNLLGLIDQYDKGRRTGVNPATGEIVAFNPSIIDALDRQIMSAFDSLSAAYKAKGDLSAAAVQQVDKTAYLLGGVQRHNTIDAAEQQRHLMLSTNKRLEAALDNPDPERALNEVRQIARDWRRFVAGLSYARSGEDRGAYTPLSLEEQVDTDFSSKAQQIASTFAALSAPGLTEDQVASILAPISTMFGGEVGAQLQGMLFRPIVDIQDRALGNSTPIITPNGTVWVPQIPTSQWLPDPNGNLIQTVVNQPDISQIQGFDPNAGDRLVDIFVDVNGTPTKRKAVATLTGALEAWGATKGIKLELPRGATDLAAGELLSEAIIQALGGVDGEKFRARVESGELVRASAIDFLSVLVPGWTDVYGVKHESETWVQDRKTGLWYQGTLPFRGLQTHTDGTVKMGAQGPMLDWKAFASASGVPAPYAGSDARAMQSLLEAGLVDVSRIKSRDINGALTPDAPDLATAYYDPAKDPGAGRDSWWKDDLRESRRKAARDDFARQRRRSSFLDANVEGPERVAMDRQSVSAKVQGLSGGFAQAGLGGISDFINNAAKALGLTMGAPDDRLPVIPKPKPADPLVLPAVNLPTYSGPQIQLPPLPKFGGLSPDERDELSAPTVPVVSLPKKPVSGIRYIAS